jgi:hypothetical protein
MSEVLAQGINTPLVMAGFILAKLTHAPNVRFATAIGQGISQEWGPLAVTRIEEVWLSKALMHVGFAVAAADLLPKYNPKGILPTRPGGFRREHQQHCLRKRLPSPANAPSGDWWHS